MKFVAFEKELCYNGVNKNYPEVRMWSLDSD